MCVCVCVCACVHSEQSYLCEPERWASACVEPQRVVLWNAFLFTVLIVTSGIQAILCTVNIINSLLGMLCGPGFGINKVAWATLFVASFVLSDWGGGVEKWVCRWGTVCKRVNAESGILIYSVQCNYVCYVYICFVIILSLFCGIVKKKLVSLSVNGEWISMFLSLSVNGIFISMFLSLSVNGKLISMFLSC